MELTPREKDKLLIFTAALLAERPYGTRGHAPLYIPQVSSRTIAWN